MAAAAAYFDIDPEQLTCPVRTQAVAERRQVTQWAVMTFVPNFSGARMAEAFQRDPTSALHGVRKVRRAIAENSGLGRVALDFADHLIKAHGYSRASLVEALAQAKQKDE